MNKGTMIFAAGILALSVAYSPAAAQCGSAQSVQKASYEQAGNTIVDLAVKAGDFKTLVAAVQAAGLADVLSGEGPFTVFAPTDKAFAKLPKGTVEALLKDKEKLTAILTYHVIPGKLMAADVVKVKDLKTVMGQKVSVNTKDGVMIDNANVIATDIVADNGVIHVIDTVILPS